MARGKRLAHNTMLVHRRRGPSCTRTRTYVSFRAEPLGRFVSRFISPIRSPVRVGLEVLAQGACGRTPLL